MSTSKTRVIVPDSHGSKIDPHAANAFLSDLRALDPEEIVMLGDHLDCNGTFSTHPRHYGTEMEESYEEDVEMANDFLDRILAAAPRAKIHYLEGNHEQHVERWASRIMLNKKDVDMLVEHFGPEKVLDLKRRGIRYYTRERTHMGLSLPGTIKLGRCYFTHGISAAKHAADVHVSDFGANVVFGHCHRAQAVVKKTLMSEAIGAWCPGTLSKLQPLYRHTTPTSWTHGYGIQFVNRSGLFQHINVSIVHGESLLQASGMLGAA